MTHGPDDENDENTTPLPPYAEGQQPPPGPQPGPPQPGQQGPQGPPHGPPQGGPPGWQQPPPQGWQQPPPGWQPPPVPYGYGYPPNPAAPYGYHPVTGAPYSDKSKVVAGVLQLVVPLGIGRFYMGDTKIGVAQLLVTLLTCGIGAIWPFIDGIIILVNDTATDEHGRPLRPS